MRSIAVILLNLIMAVAIGCGSNAALDEPDLKERAVGLAKDVRDAMNQPSLMQLDEGRMADSGLRGIRQREVAKPFMPKLIECGKAAEEPLWELINDADESISRSCVILVGRTRTTDGFKPIDSQKLIDLSIPLLERALASEDRQVRYFACGGLGDFGTWSDECMERVRLSLPKLRELQKDPDEEVRGLGWVVCNNLTAALSTRAKNAEDRQAAAQEWEKLQQEKNWKEPVSAP